MQPHSHVAIAQPLEMIYINVMQVVIEKRNSSALCCDNGRLAIVGKKIFSFQKKIESNCLLRFSGSEGITEVSVSFLTKRLTIIEAQPANVRATA